MLKAASIRLPIAMRAKRFASRRLRKRTQMNVRLHISEIRKQRRSNQDINRGAGKRYPQFLFRLRGALQPRYAADRIEDDFKGPDAVAVRNSDVAEFMQQNRGKQGEDVDGVEGSRFPAPSAQCNDEDYEENEGEVQSNRHSEDADGPTLRRRAFFRDLTGRDHAILTIPFGRKSLL